MRKLKRLAAVPAVALAAVTLGAGAAHADTGGNWYCRTDTGVATCIATSGGVVYASTAYTGYSDVLYADVYQATPGHLGAMVAQFSASGNDASANGSTSQPCSTYLVALGYWSGGSWHGLWESPIEANC